MTGISKRLERLEQAANPAQDEALEPSPVQDTATVSGSTP